MNPTALSLNTDTGEIRLPVGGTGGFIARLRLKDGATVDPANSIVLFAASNSRDIASRFHHAAFIKKELPILEDEDGLYVYVSFVNADTRKLTPGHYVWDLTLVTDPERDEFGTVIVEDDSDNVIPIFAKTGKMPAFVLCEVTVIV